MQVVLKETAMPLPSKLTRVDSRRMRAPRTATLVTPSTSTDNNLLPDCHDPFTLQQLRRAGPPLRIPLEAPLEELDPFGA